MALAAALVRSVLEGVSPRDFFKRHANDRYRPSMATTTFELEAEPEYDDPEGHFTEQADVDYVRDQIERGNIWGWCCAKVTATWTDPVTEKEYEGTDYLGGCSYRSREDFMQPGGYYDDMKHQAFSEIEAAWERDQAKG